MGFHDAQHSGRSGDIVAPPLAVDWSWIDTIPYDNNPPTPPRYLFHWLPLFYDGKICFQGGANSNRLFCLNPQTGAQVFMTGSNYTANGTYLFQFLNYPAAVSSRFLTVHTDISMAIRAADGFTDDSMQTWNVVGGWPYGGIAVKNGKGYFQYIRSDEWSCAYWIQPDPILWQKIYAGVYRWPDNTNTFADYALRIPALADGKVYLNLLQRLHVTEDVSGLPVWTWGKKCSGPNIDSAPSPAVWNQTVYFGCAGTLYALDVANVNYPPQQDGTAIDHTSDIPVKWSLPIPGAVAPIVDNGVVYVGSSNNNFYALDANTGAERWKFTTGAPFTSMQMPALSGNVLYVPGADAHLRAFDALSGALLWDHTGPAAWGPVAIGAGRLFASTNDVDLTFWAFRPAAAPAACDLNQDGRYSTADVSIAVSQALGISACTAARCDAARVSRTASAALGLGCQ